MPEWQIGYPAGLDTVANEDDGIKLYNAVYTNSITLASAEPLNEYFVVSSVNYNPDTGYTEIVGSGVSWVTDAFKNGTVIIRSFESNNVGEGWKVASNNTSTIFIIGDVSSQIVAGDYMEVHNGASTLSFSNISQYNPVRKEIKRGFQDIDFAMPYYDMGLVIPLGRAKEEIIFNIILTKTDTMTVHDVLNRFEWQLLKRLDYTGQNAHVTKGDVAPQVLDNGYEQYLIYIKGIQPVYDPKSLGNDAIELKVTAFILHNK